MGKELEVVLLGIKGASVVVADNKSGGSNYSPGTVLVDYSHDTLRGRLLAWEWLTLYGNEDAPIAGYKFSWEPTQKPKCSY